MTLPAAEKRNFDWVYDLLLLVVLLIGAYFRFTGVEWDEGVYLHPDERFLAIVESKLEPVGSLGEYWDTSTSTLNPNNKGEGFFVYGTLPIFLVRYVMEALEMTGYGDVALIGRPLAAVFDLITVVILYLVGSRLYGRRVGLLAAAFSTAAVLQIQLSHFFTVDIFANVFIWLALYFGVWIATRDRPLPEAPPEEPADPEGESETGNALLPEPISAAQPYRAVEPKNDPALYILQALKNTWRHPLLLPILLFGLVTGAAAASKISAFPVAFLLPAAVWAYFQKTARKIELAPLWILMAVSGFLAALSFRVFQPYAFSGPGFFGILPNPNWLETIGRLQELVQFSSGYPPSVQWYERPIWFSGQNLTTWGLGLPLGIAAWAGFLWMGFRMLRGEWHRHLVVWAWIGGHFLWQSMAPNPTMRYQLPIYPGMALMAAWGLVRLWDVFSARQGALRRAGRALAAGLGAAVLVLTLVYAAAFTNIYRKQVTRLEASRWMYANLPGALTLRLQSPGGESISQPLPYPNGLPLRADAPYSSPFIAHTSGQLQQIIVPHIRTASPGLGAASFYLTMTDESQGGQEIGAGLTGISAADPEGRLVFNFVEPIEFEAFGSYRIGVDLVAFNGTLDLCKSVTLFYLGPDGTGELVLAPPVDCLLSSDARFEIDFTPETTGTLHSVRFGAPELIVEGGPTRVITIEIWSAGGAELLGYTVTPFQTPAVNTIFTLSQPVPLTKEQPYEIRIRYDGGEPLEISGTVLASETSWDDPLPMRLDGYDGFAGIYRGDNNLELYWEDNPDKVDRVTDILHAVDVIPISSSRQWGSLTRLPERWPLVDAFYRNLMGCPAERTVEWCYNVAEPGMFTGMLGFELVQVFQSNPTLGWFEVNDQFSEEAFTVYDHPKVFIFIKTDEYDPAAVEALFDTVDLSAVVVGEDAVKPLTLTAAQAEAQRASGTWMDLFHPDSLVNRSQPLTVLIWYAAVGLVGLAVFPLVALALPGLEDRGYPLARIAGLLLLAYLVWLPGSLGLPVTRLTISIAILLLAAAGAAAFARSRAAIMHALRSRWRYVLSIETLALLLFLVMLVIRAANPDLWHPWKGGEKPMDFAYFNAVLKSVSFPPYDPWFAGGYINYYYYGYVLVGTLVKWLGIVPAVAYNLIVPTLFMLVGLGAFSIGWNLVKGRRDAEPVALSGAVPEDAAPAPASVGMHHRNWGAAAAGLAATLGISLLGNLGSVRMILQGYQRVAMPPGTELSEAFFMSRWIWGLRGFIEVLTTDIELPYALADWYWNPSRAIPAPGDIEPITEFPFFTFLYGDLHAHMIAIPITLFALAWMLSVVLAKGRWRSIGVGAFSFVLGGLAIGALRPTNTWDYPTYLVLGMVAVAYTAMRYAAPALKARFEGLPPWTAGLLAAVSGALWLAALSFFLYHPYTRSYALGYTDINLWQASHTPLSAYLTHWGLFLFAILSWMLWETRDWLAATPAVAGIRFLRRQLEFIVAGLLIAAAATAYLLYLDIETSLYLVPLLVWTGILVLRPGLDDRKRIALFLTGTGIFLTLMVETIVLSGDIGRMNTVFKFYLQVWVLFGTAAAFGLGFLVPRLSAWNRTWRQGWQTILVLLVAGAALYPLLGGFAKMKDRASDAAPVTLDGMAYMQYATYFDEGRELFLVEDYRAIRWMQENIAGTPVIVEGQVVEYRWGARYSIYTGLPTVLGWNWHQRQQRTGHDVEVWARDGAVDEFYTTTNVNIAKNFLAEYGVEYIILGQMERANYDGPGIEKFETFNGVFWQEIYRDGETVIFQVLETAR